MCTSTILNPKPEDVKVWFKLNQNNVCVTEKQNVWSDISRKTQASYPLFRGSQDAELLLAYWIGAQKSFSQQLYQLPLECWALFPIPWHLSSYQSKFKQAMGPLDLSEREGQWYCVSQAPGFTVYSYSLGTLEAGSLQHAKEPGYTLLPMSEHLTERKKQHPGTLVISIFHTLACMCFMSQQRLISPTHCHRIILCDKAQSETPTKWKKAKSPKRKVTVTAINTGPNHTHQGGTDESSGRPELGRGGPRGIGGSVRGFCAKNIFLSPPTETSISYKWGSCVTTTDNIFQLGRDANSHPCENISACSQQGLLTILSLSFMWQHFQGERTQHLGDTFVPYFYSTPNIESSKPFHALLLSR